MVPARRSSFHSGPGLLESLPVLTKLLIAQAVYAAGSREFKQVELLLRNHPLLVKEGLAVKADVGWPSPSLALSPLPRGPKGELTLVLVRVRWQGKRGKRCSSPPPSTRTSSPSLPSTPARADPAHLRRTVIYDPEGKPPLPGSHPLFHADLRGVSAAADIDTVARQYHSQRIAELHALMRGQQDKFRSVLVPALAPSSNQD